MSNANKWLSDLECADRESPSWNKILAVIYDVKPSPSELCKVFKGLAMFRDASQTGVWIHLGPHTSSVFLVVYITLSLLPWGLSSENIEQENNQNMVENVGRRMESRDRQGWSCSFLSQKFISQVDRGIFPSKSSLFGAPAPPPCLSFTVDSRKKTN